MVHVVPPRRPSYPAPGYFMRQPPHRLLTALVAILAMLGTAPFAARQDVTPTNVTSMAAAEFFTPTRVWTAHLSMSAEAWQAMQPQYGAGGGGGFGNRFLGPPGEIGRAP